jgi:hypothetical protein
VKVNVLVIDQFLAFSYMEMKKTWLPVTYFVQRFPIPVFHGFQKFCRGPFFFCSRGGRECVLVHRGGQHDFLECNFASVITFYEDKDASSIFLMRCCAQSLARNTSK